MADTLVYLKHMGFKRVFLGLVSSHLLSLTVHDNVYLLLISGKHKKQRKRDDPYITGSSMCFLMCHIFIVLSGMLS